MATQNHGKQALLGLNCERRKTHGRHVDAEVSLVASPYLIPDVTSLAELMSVFFGGEVSPTCTHTALQLLTQHPLLSGSVESFAYTEDDGPTTHLLRER